jgi:hypothetical protein
MRAKTKRKPAGWSTRQAFLAWRMDLQAHVDLEALHEPLHEGEAKHRAGSTCGGKAFSVKSHVHLQLGNQKTKNPVACGLPGLVELRRPSLRM